MAWRFHFVGHGTLLEPARDVVALDVGGQLCPGIVDQHQDGRLGRSTCELLLRFPELVYGHLMNGWLERRDDGQALGGREFAPTIVTHGDPDFDAMVSAWLVRHLVERGAYPPYVAALADYVSRVDQGAVSIDLDGGDHVTDALHLAYLGIMHARHHDNRSMLADGFHLLETTLASLVAARGSPFAIRPVDFVPQPGGALAAWRQDEAFREVSDALRRDLGLYLNRDRPAAETMDCLLPAADGGDPIATRAFIAPRPTESKLNKFWVRANGFPYFICPLADNGRVILSLDPTWRADGRRPSLRGLGFRLEQAESERRRASGATDQRGLPPRFDDGTCDNADPWYDGRGHDHTIVDTPRAGTILPYPEIVRIATGEFWHVRLQEAVVHLAVPAAGNEVEALFAGGKLTKRPALPARVSDGLHDWFAESWEVTGSRIWRGGSAPPGFRISGHTVRRFPGASATTLRLLELRLDPTAPEAATVDGLATWLDGESAARRGRIYYMAQIDPEPGAHAIGDPETLLAKVCLGSVQRVALSDQARVVLFNRRAIAIRRLTGSAVADDREALFRECLLYAAFQAEALDAYLGRVLQAVQPGHSKRGSTLWRDFLEFRARFVHEDVVQEDDVALVYAGLRDAMSLGARHEKVSRELERLDQIERDEGEGIKDYILFGIGLTGVIQAWYTIQWPGFPADNRALFIGVLGVLTALYAGRRRVTRLLTRGPARPKPAADLSDYTQRAGAAKSGGE